MNNYLDRKGVKTKVFISVSLLVTFAISNCMLGCASQPDKLQSQYVSPLQYKDYDCEQIEDELEKVSNRVTTLYTDLKKKADGDSAQMAVGMIIFWPALFFLEGGDGPEANEYSRLKGEKAALDEIAIHKKCPIDLDQYELLTDKLKREEKQRLKEQGKTVPKIAITESYRIAIFPLNIYASGGLPSYIGDLTYQGIRAIAAVAADDENLTLIYCYKEFQGINSGNPSIKNVATSQNLNVWKKRSFFSFKEPDWDEIRKNGLEIDADLIAMIGGDLSRWSFEFYLYSPGNNKLYSVKADAHYSSFGNVAEKTIRALVEDFYYDQL